MLLWGGVTGKMLCICCVDSLNTGFIICCWAVWSEKLSVHSVSWRARAAYAQNVKGFIYRRKF